MIVLYVLGGWLGAALVLALPVGALLRTRDGATRPVAAENVFEARAS